VADFNNLDRLFEKNSFDAAWAMASLLHTPKNEIKGVLKQVYFVVKPGGKVFIGLKEGDGEVVVESKKYGKKIKRSFVYWKEDDFSVLVEDCGFKIENVIKHVTEDEEGTSTWLNYFLQVRTS